MQYRLAKCCSPREGDRIIAFLKQDQEVFSVHRADCVNVRKVPAHQLVTVRWDEITVSSHEKSPSVSDTVFAKLDQIDIAVLQHHRDLGLDYGVVVARRVGIPRAEAFIRHRKLSDLGLLQRVEPRMIRYRKGIVDGKWIKHRHHTYYALTQKGNRVLDRRAGEKPQ